MQVAANIAVGFVAMLHFVIAAVEMFLSRGSWFQEKLKSRLTRRGRRMP